MLVYSLLKNAQTAMARSLGKQVASHGITVNNFVPGVIDTDRSRDRLVDASYRKMMLGKIPAARVGTQRIALVRRCCSAPKRGAIAQGKIFLLMVE